MEEEFDEFAPTIDNFFIDGGDVKEVVKGSGIREQVSDDGRDIHTQQLGGKECIPVVGFCCSASKAKEMRPEIICGLAINLHALSSSFCKCLKECLGTIK